MAGLVLAIIAMLGIGGFPVSADGAATPRKIVLAYAAMNARVAALWIARERGSLSKTASTQTPCLCVGHPR